LQLLPGYSNSNTCGTFILRGLQHQSSPTISYYICYCQIEFYWIFKNTSCCDPKTLSKGHGTRPYKLYEHEKMSMSWARFGGQELLESLEIILYWQIKYFSPWHVSILCSPPAQNVPGAGLKGNYNWKYENGSVPC
jgi:hypothetical protein